MRSILVPELYVLADLYAQNVDYLHYMCCHSYNLCLKHFSFDKLQ